MRKTLEKHDIFILRRYLGTTRCHDGTQNFLKRKFDTSAFKWRVTRVFCIVRTEIISKNKRTSNKVSWLYFLPKWSLYVKFDVFRKFHGWKLSTSQTLNSSKQMFVSQCKLSRFLTKFTSNTLKQTLEHDFVALLKLALCKRLLP